MRILRRFPSWFGLMWCCSLCRFSHRPQGDRRGNGNRGWCLTHCGFERDGVHVGRSWGHLDPSARGQSGCAGACHVCGGRYSGRISGGCDTELSIIGKKPSNANVHICGTIVCPHWLDHSIEIPVLNVCRLMCGIFLFNYFLECSLVQVVRIASAFSCAVN